MKFQCSSQLHAYVLIREDKIDNGGICCFCDTSINELAKHGLLDLHPWFHLLIKKGSAWLCCASRSATMFEISDDSSNDSSQKDSIMTLHTLLHIQEDINSIEHVDILAYVKQDAKHDTRPNIFNYLVG
jgi:hypothetical protein